MKRATLAQHVDPEIREKQFPGAATATTPVAAESPEREDGTPLQDEATRDEMIAVAAYFKAEQRGFAAGCELDDWLCAEAEIDARLHRPEARA